MNKFFVSALASLALGIGISVSNTASANYAYSCGQAYQQCLAYCTQVPQSERWDCREGCSDNRYRCLGLPIP
jgi:hypothetical protein